MAGSQRAPITTGSNSGSMAIKLVNKKGICMSKAVADRLATLPNSFFYCLMFEAKSLRTVIQSPLAPSKSVQSPIFVSVGRGRPLRRP